MTMQHPDGEAADTQGSLEGFCSLVMSDPSLQAMLQIYDVNDFVAAVVELGRQHGFVFAAEDVGSAMRSNRATLTKNRINA